MPAPTTAANRLSREKSPYLLQHAQNPVDWFPWGEEAFDKAVKEDKPVFLSVGYSTCHWCHVMARESFMDERVAARLNRDFVPVKVDREERPDVDNVYMSVCQMLTGSGGWPLTAILTPDKKPFFAGTYFPTSSRFGLPGLLDILDAVANAWSEDPGTLRGQAERIYLALKAGEVPASGNGAKTTKETAGRWDVVEKAYRHLSESFDEEHGGFGSAPKFPTTHSLAFLLRYWKRTGERRALEVVEKTLEAAYAGGIYDHVGFGFFRYSTDAKWLTPHFEKMLYDQALMIMAYTELWLATKKDVYREIVYEVASFLDAEMKSPEGAFWSAIDAESEGEEGKFYVWTPGEIANVLGAVQGRAFCRQLGITEEGNFHGKSIPNLIREDPRTGRAERAIASVPSKDRRKVYEARAKRSRPFVDDKVLTSWNALVAASLAKAGRAFRDGSLTDTASACLGFIEENLLRGGALCARYREGEVARRAYLDDYAFLIWAYLEMGETTLDGLYRDKAAKLARRMVELFWDPGASSFFVTAKGAKEELIVRPRETWDGAIPSGSSVAVMDLLRLSRLHDDEGMGEIAAAAIDRLLPAMRREPTGLTHLVSAVMYDEGGAQDVIVFGPRDDPRVQAMLSYLCDVYLPFAQVKLAEDRSLSEFAASAGAGEPSLVICGQMRCSAPVRSVEELQKALLIPRPAEP